MTLRTIKYLKNFMDHKKGEIEEVDVDVALNLISQGWADIYKKKQKPQQIRPEKKGFLPMRDFRFFKALKRDKRFLVEGLIRPNTVNMLYSPPENYKSITALWMGLCIATQRPFLGFKTKKYPVLICDKENNLQLLKRRLLGMREGLRLRYHHFPLYILAGEGSLDDTSWVDTLKKTIQHYKIKLVVFDTLHRFSAYEENKADDLNRLYTTTFQPLISECDCSILFLHHSTKEGRYRGSSDFLGQVDTAYSVKKVGKETRFKMFCEKNRWAEVKEVMGEWEFNENSILAKEIPETDLKREEIGKVSYIREVTLEIQNCFPIVGSIVSKSEVIDHFEVKNKSWTPDTMKRALRWLVRNDYLKRIEKGKYQRIWKD